MSEHPALWILTAVGVLIGILTGLGTIIGWMVSESFRETLYAALRVAGVLYFLAGVCGAIYMAIQDRRRGEYLQSAFWVLVGSCILGFLAWIALDAENDEQKLAALGVVGIGTSITFGIRGVKATQRHFERIRMQCPGCAETIKRKAGVCKPVVIV